MKKNILKYALISFLMLIVLLLSNNIYFNIKSEIMKKEIIYNISEQIEYIIKNENKLDKNFEKLLINGYYITGKSIDVILEQNSSLYFDSIALKDIAEKLELSEINILNDKCDIIASTNESYIGLHLDPNENQFYKLLKQSDIEYIENITNNNINKDDLRYLSLKRENSDEIIQIGFIPREFLAYKEKNTIETLLNTINIKFSNVIFYLFDKNTENIIASSPNSLELVLDDIRIDYTDESSKYYKTKINSNKYYIIEKTFDNYILYTLISINNLYSNLTTVIIINSLFILAIIVIIIILINKIFSLYAKRILNRINNLKNSNINIKLKNISIFRLNEIEESINDILLSLEERNYKFEKILLKFNLKIGLFNYSKKFEKLFLVGNIKSILNINTKYWGTLKNNPNAFLELLNDISNNVIDSEGKIYKTNSNNFVKLNMYSDKNSYYGIVQDVTKEYSEKQNLIESLKYTKIKAETDTFTGLLNKKSYMEYVEQSLERSTTGVMFLFDLDNFKNVNDTLGHAEGDRLLKKFSKKLKELFRENDYVSRIGGDEFSVFIKSDMCYDSLILKSDNVIKELRKSLKVYYENCKVTVSIGITTVSDKYSNFEDLYKETDRRLYVAKHRGKDNYYYEQNHI